jgi:hypothetical protein
VTSAPTQAFLHLQFQPSAAASVVSVVAATVVAASAGVASVVIHAGKHNLFRTHKKREAFFSASLFYCVFAEMNQLRIFSFRGTFSAKIGHFRAAK